MITRGIRSYMDRDWAAVRASKDAYWAERIDRLGAIEGLRIAEQLRLQVLRRDPEWPSADQRREDLAHHVHFAEKLRRADRSRRG